MTVLVIGATGLTGSTLVEQLIKDDRFSQIIAFSRSPLMKENPKLQTHLVDFSKPDTWKHLVVGDVLFSALGTTLQKAGSKEAQFVIDYTYQYHFAKAASDNKVSQYILVSAAYSSPQSKIFYSRMKGVLEKDISKLPFQHISIIKPGIIAGNRKEKRLAERFSVKLFNLLHHVPGLRFTKPIRADTIAKAMINATVYHPKQLNVYELTEVLKLAEMP